MKTDDLIALLAADTAPVPRRSAPAQIGIALAAGVVLAAGAMLLMLGPRPDLAQAVAGPPFWLKLLFPVALAAASFSALTRLAVPGVRARAGAVAVAVPLVLLWLVAVAAYVAAPPPERAALVWGQTWRVCTLNIVMIAIPVFAATLFALRRLAPTRLALAGACAGVLGGAAGAAVYAFHCPESAPPFIAVWYVAGIAVVAAVGAGLGPRVLRW
jgi:hypothetical protein